MSWVGALLYCFKLSLRHVLDDCFPPAAPPPPTESIVTATVPRGCPDLVWTVVYVNIYVMITEKKTKIIIITIHVKHFTYFIVFPYKLKYIIQYYLLSHQVVFVISRKCHLIQLDDDLYLVFASIFTSYILYSIYSPFLRFFSSTLIFYIHFPNNSYCLWIIWPNNNMFRSSLNLFCLLFLSQFMQIFPYVFIAYFIQLCILIFATLIICSFFFHCPILLISLKWTL